MSSILDDVRKSPALARSVPFLVFLVLTQFQSSSGDTTRFWVYLAKTLVGGWLLWDLRGALPEMKWEFSREAVFAGVGVFVMWVAIDPFYPGQDQLLFQLGFGKDPSKEVVKLWNPFEVFGAGSLAGWGFVLVRTLGSSIVVPPMEELFFRSFLYRYLITPEFERIPLGRMHKASLILTCLAFAAIHQQWLSAILCGLVYQGLVLRKGRIGDAMAAHGITNFLLALWVVFRPAWQFW